MADTSIALKLHDNFSQAIVAMKNNLTPFRRDVEALQQELDYLDGAKFSLKVDMDKAKREVNEAKRAFRELGSEENRLRLESAEADYSNIRRELGLVSSQARETEKDMKSASGAISRADNRAGSRTGSSAIDALAKAGGLALLGQAASGMVNASVGSALGSEAGTLFSSVLSGVATGAAMGSIATPVGAAVGAVIGGISGLVTGGASAFASQDEAFKSVVQDQYNAIQSGLATDLTAGSALAGQRETDQISFSTLLGGEAIAEEYLAQVRNLANRTPFLYGDLTAMSKTLATYGYTADNMIPTLSTIGDAGAALGMGTSDMTMVATALGRMKSSDKTSLEYLNILNDRGIGAVGILSEAFGVDQGTMYDMISKGQVSGKRASQLILDALTESFAGSMEAQSLTFTGLTSTVEGLTQELQAAMGAGYNDARKSGLEAQIDYLGGESGSALQEGYSAIGTWKAKQENEKEQLQREAMKAMLGSDEYLKAKAEEDYAEMGRLMGKAQTEGLNAYYSSEGYGELVEYQQALAGDIRQSVYDSDSWRNVGYTMAQEMSKGMAQYMEKVMPGGTWSWDSGDWMTPSANEAASMQRATQQVGGDIKIEFRDTVIRETADAEEVAQVLVKEVSRVRAAGIY